jgi:enoyl-CoA hydratase
MTDRVLYAKEGRVARLTLNSPENLNAWQFPRHEGGMTIEFREKLDRAREDDAVTTVLIDAKGPSFSSGADVTHIGNVYGIGDGKENKQRRPSQRTRLQRDDELVSFYRELFLFPKITVAQVQGVCLGLGFILVSCCDLAVAADDARFMRSDQRMGLAANSMDFNHLVHNIGLKRTMALLLTGGTLSGAQAAEWGLVNEAVPADDLAETARALAEQVSLLPRDGVAMGKALRTLNYEALGLLQGMDLHTVGHTLFTNIRWEEDEFNYFRERREQGHRSAYKARDKHYTSATAPTRPASE